MNTYLVKWQTNYGEMFMIVNAKNELWVHNDVYNRGDVWDNYTVEEIDTKTQGIVAYGGGDHG